MNYKSLNSAIRSVTNPQPELVKEDIQTPQRKAEGEKDIKNLTGTYKRRIKKAAGIPNPHVRSNASDDALERANDALTNLSNRTAKHETERRSTELYGHRGKIINKKATVKEEQTAQLSSKQRAAAMKDRNSRIHRTPAELKAHDAGMKAYVKSQNNMTDSKGKKLHPYDDYQS